MDQADVRASVAAFGFLTGSLHEVNLVGAAWDFDARRSVVNEALSPSSCNRKALALYNFLLSIVRRAKYETYSATRRRKPPNAFPPLRAECRLDRWSSCIRSMSDPGQSAVLNRAQTTSGLPA